MAAELMIWDISKLSSGLYLVEVLDESGQMIWQTKAIIK